MAKRQTDTDPAAGTETAATSTQDGSQMPALPDDVRDADPEQTPTRGGSYVIEGGVRRLVERTEQP